MANPNLDEVTDQRRRTMLIAGVLALVVVLIGAGVGLALLAHRPVATKPPIVPARETTATPSVSASPTSSLAATGSAIPTSTVTTTSTTPPSTTSGLIVRSGRIAYRFEGHIWVASEDGTGAKQVYAADPAAYSLSPDGKTLVAAAGATTYALIDTTSLTQQIITGPIDLPVWSPDSSWLAYTARVSTSTASSGYAVRRVNRDGSKGVQLLVNAARPQIAPDGVRIAVSQSPDPGPTDILRVYDNGLNGSKVVRAVANGKGAQTFAWAAGGILYFSKDRIGTASGFIGVTNKAISKSSVVATLPVGDPPVSPGALFPSPDGTKALFALIGDDGHSRLEIADSAAKKITALTSLFDEYPVGWLLDGSAVLFIRGNSIQGEATALWRARPNNTKRAELIRNANR